MTADRTADLDALPVRPEEIDADWLTRALEPRFPGVQVRDIEIIEKTELTNSRARLRMTYEQQAGAPDSLFLKLLPLDPAKRPSMALTKMGPFEARFYERLAPSLSMRVPAAYLTDERPDGTFVLGLEDLVESGCEMSDGTWGVQIDAAAGALADLADLHVRFADDARREAEAGWVLRSTPAGDYGANLLREALEHHRDRISNEFASISEVYIDQRPALHALWDAPPHTVIHGDAHIGNLFLDHGRTGFLDWGVIRATNPLRDVSYFLNLSLDIEDRRAHERDLLREYVERWNAGTGITFTFDEAWTAHRILASTLVPASCQIVTFPEMTPARAIFAEAYLARAEAALNDLESRDALRAAGL